MPTQPLPPELKKLQTEQKKAFDLERKKEAHLAEQVESEQPTTPEAQVAGQVNAINIPEEEEVAGLVNDIPIDEEETPELEGENQPQQNRQDDEDRKRQEAQRQLNEYKRQEAATKRKEAEAQAKQQQATKSESEPKDTGTEPKEPYAKQGGPAVKTKERPPIGKAPATAEKTVATGEKAAGSASRAASAVGRGAAKVGETGAKAAQATAKVAAQAGKLAAQAAAWVGRGLAALASTPYGWIIIVIVLIIILIVISAIGIYGATVGSPNAAGKSMTDIQPVYEITGVLADISSKSNIGDVETMMTKQKDSITIALQNVEYDLKTKVPAGPDVTRSQTLIEEIRQILNQVSTTNPQNNQKLAQDFQNKVKELVKMWIVSDDTIPGTTNPIKVAITSFGQTYHWCTQLHPGDCGTPGHRSIFGMGENSAGVTLTADAVDLGAPFDTPIYAPFEGDYHDDGIGYTIKGSANGIPMEAVLGHCSIAGGRSSSGHIKVGEVICTLSHRATSSPHLHFELRVNGKDIHRSTATQTQKDLWRRMSKILNGQP